MKITVIGTGYVGLVSGACLSEFGHTVYCVDSNIEKIERLKIGDVPIYEPGLDKILKKHTNGNLFFTSDLGSCINDSDLVFIAVGTPQNEDGSTDLTYIKGASADIAKYIDHDIYIVIKSTVPVGTGQIVIDTIKHSLRDTLKDKVNIYISSNPEFLKEGSAIKDFMYPDRIVIGSDDEESKNRLTELYKGFTFKDNHKTTILYTDVKSAQLIKYASNSFLATKISFVSSLIPYCEEVGANIEDVVTGMGLDTRIGNKFLKPGVGFGGSCFPKDVASLKHEYELVLSKPNFLLDATLDINEDAHMWPVNQLFKIFGYQYGPNKYEFSKNHDLKIAVLGLAFKPETDDVRCAPAIKLIEGLSQFYKVSAHDPIAVDNAKATLDKTYAKMNNISFHTDIYEAVKDVDIIIVMTEWNIYQNLSVLEMNKIKTFMKGNIVIDGRNALNYRRASAIFDYHSI